RDKLVTGVQTCALPISSLQQALLARVGAALDRADVWARLKTDWVALDCELMPWSVKAQQLLRQQYAAVGAAARSALGVSVAAIRSEERRVGKECRARWS